MTSVGRVVDALDEVETRAHARAIAEELDRKYAGPVEIERALVAACLLESTAADAAIEVGVVADDFCVRSLGLTWEAIASARLAGRTSDPVTIAGLLTEAGKLEQAGGLLELSRLEAQIVSAAPARGYAGVVRNSGMLRRIATACRLGAVAATKAGAVAADVAAEIVMSIDATERQASTLRSNGEVARRIRETTPALGGRRSVVRTGFADLDRALGGGLACGDLVVVAARPSMGKSALAAQMAEHAARKGVALVFSLEMSAEQIHLRLAAARARVNPNNQHLQLWQQSRLEEAVASVADSTVIVDDGASLGVEQVLGRSRTVARRNHLRLVVVDYLQLLRLPNEDRRVEALGFATRALKQLARELLVPVVVVSQLNRGVEARADKRPMMSDLRESGAIEQDADVIALLYREEYYLGEKTPEHMRGVAEVNVAKNRNGPTTTVQLHWGVADDDPRDAPPRFANLGRDMG